MLVETMTAFPSVFYAAKQQKKQISAAVNFHVGWSGTNHVRTNC
tara:strand:+ start:272 stop:403 length:132 start_codon:yes stop_codon:yes gene_type:complete